MATKTGYSAGRVYLQVVPSYRNFLSSLRRDAAGPLGKAIADTFEKELEKSGAKSGESFSQTVRKNIEKGLETDRLTADVRKKLDKAFSDLGDGPDASSWRKSLERIRDDIEETGRVEDKHIRQLEQLGTALSQAGHQTEDLARKHRLLAAASTVDADAARAHAASLRDVSSSSERTSSAENDRDRAHRNTTSSADSSSRAGRGLSAVLRNLRGDSQDGANAFRFFNFSVLAVAAVGAGLVPVLAAMVGGLALLGPVLLGLGAGLGVAALGFSGIGEAVGALGQQQDDAGTSAKTYANTMRSAARAVADARRGLKDAYRQSADGIRSALERQGDAERSLADAQKDAKQAQVDLTEARKDAAEEQADLATKIAQNQLDERQGVIDLFNAYNNYGAVMSDGGSTNLEREQADIALKQAQLNLVKIRTEQKKLTEEKAKADKGGIEGSDKVRNAQERLTDALDRQRQAERRLARAARDTIRARQDGARTIADAQRQLARAQEDYATAADQTAASTTKVNQAMDKLSPAGQRFARFLFGLKKGMLEVRGIAQEGMLPGVEAGMRSIIDTYGPGFKAFVKDISTEMGDLFDEAGDRLSKGGFRGFFSQLGKDSKFYTRDAGKGLLDLLEGVSNIFVIASPYAREFSKYIADTMKSFNGWTSSEEGRTKLQNFFAYVDRIGPKVKDFFLSVGEALGAMAIALAPLGESVLSHLTDFFGYIADLEPGQLRVLGAALLSVVVALQASAGITAMVSLLGALAAAPLLLIVAGVIGIATAFFLLGRSGEKNKKMFKDLLAAATPALKFFKSIYTEIKDHLVKLWEERLLPILKSLGAQIRDEFLPAFNRILPVLRPIVSFFVDVFFAALDNIFTVLGEVVGGFITVLSGLLDFVTGVFTGDWKLAWSGIKKIFSGSWRIIRGVISGAITNIKDTVRFGLEALKGIAKKPLEWIGDKFVGMKDKAIEALEGLRDKSKDIMGEVRDFLKKPIVSFLDFVLNDGLVDGVRTLQGWVGVKEKNKLAHLGGFGGKYANGGVLPGYTPGRDVHHFVSPTGGSLHLSGGEGILVPQATKMIGGKAGIDRINRMAKQGMAFAKGGVIPSFAGGGLFGGTGSFTEKFANTLLAAQRKAGVTFQIMQRGFRPATSYSGTSHQGDAVDLGPITVGVVKALRSVGVAAWDRTGKGNWAPHIHGVPLPGAGNAGGSGIGQAQDYLRGGDGLGGRDNGPKVSWNGKSSGGSGILGDLGDKLSKLGSVAKGALKSPERYLKKRIDKGFDQVGPLAAGPLELLKGVPKRMLGSVVDKVKKMAMKGLDLGKDFFSIPFKGVKKGVDLLSKIPHPKLYDQGGMLPPGLSTVFNATGKPEPVFSSEQWDKIIGGGGLAAGGDTYQLHAEGADPRQVVGEFMAQLNRQKRMARRSGNLARKGQP